MILITGASGTVGREVVRALSKTPLRLVSRDAAPGSAAPDFYDPATFGPALEQVRA